MTRLICAVLFAASVSLATESAAVRKLLDALEAAENARDPKLYSALFAEGGDQRTAQGYFHRGVAEVQRNQGQAFTGIYKDAKVQFSAAEIRFVRDDVALVDFIAERTGVSGPDGKPIEGKRKYLVTMVAVKQEKEWKVSAIRSSIPVPLVSGGPTVFDEKPPQP